MTDPDEELQNRTRYVEGRVGFTADRRVHLSAFGDSAIWAVAVIGSGHVPHASPDFLRRRRLEYPLAVDA